MARFRRPPFDPSGPFAAQKDFMFDGDQILKGQSFGEGLPMRQLRQLYTHRLISLIPKLVKKVEPKKSKSTPLSRMDDDTILNLATATTGVKYRSVVRARKALADFK